MSGTVDPKTMIVSPLSRREFGRVAVILALILFFSALPALIGDELAPGADALRLEYPTFDHVWSMITRGELPTWSNTIMTGYPILSGAHALLFYLPTWVYGVFHSVSAFNMLWFVQLWSGGLGAYVLARQFGVTWIGASAAALAMMFGASFVARVAAGHMGLLFVCTWMPWLLIMLHRLAQVPGWRQALPLSVVSGMMLLIGSGGYQDVMYSGVLATFWFLYWLVTMPAERRARFVAWVVVGGLLGVALSAVQTLPSLDLLRQGNRQGTLSDDELNIGALPVPMAFGYFFPHTFDDPSITDYLWPEYALYTGTAIIVLALYALWTLRRRTVIRLWGVLILAALILSFGLQTPFYRWVLTIFPPYGLVRNPARQTVVIQVGLVLLAGFGLDRLIQMPSSALPRHRVRWCRIGIAASVLVMILAATYTLEAEESFSILPERALRGAVWFAAAWLAFWLALRLVRAMPGSVTRGVLLAVIAVDLLLYAFPLFYGHNEVGTLAFFAPENYPDNPRYAVLLRETDAESEELVRVLQAADYGVPIANVYTSILPERAVGFSNLLTGRAADFYLENHLELDTFARPDLLDMASVRWVLAASEQADLGDPSLVYVRDVGDLHLYENPEALPLVRLVPDWVSVDSAAQALALLEQSGIDYSEQAVIEGTVAASVECTALDETPEDVVGEIDFASGNITMTVQTGGPRLLIVNQTYVTGWQAWANDEPVTVYPANYRWLGVYLPCAGAYDVHLRYLPQTLRIGAAISLAALTLVIMGGLIAWRQTARGAVTSDL